MIISCGARRVVIPAVCGLACLSFFDSPGFGLAFTIAEETDLASYNAANA
jgi:hypothetical protein